MRNSEMLSEFPAEGGTEPALVRVCLMSWQFYQLSLRLYEDAITPSNIFTYCTIQTNKKEE